jgi:hypothetical protein
MTPEYADTLRERKQIFQQITKTKKNLFITLIATEETKKHEHYLNIMTNTIGLDALFHA